MTASVFDRGSIERQARAQGHEQVVFHRDEATGLKAIIAIYSTALGPALGGTRFYPYAREGDALDDVLALAKGMAYKNALAGLDLGGGKAVIIGDPATGRSEALLRAYGRFVQSLDGRYITACDVGTSVADMDVVATQSRFVTGRSAGAGDSSVLTAFGVFQGMRACAEHRWGTPELTGRRVGVVGVGKVGRHLVGHLLGAGAEVVISDVDAVAVARTTADHPGVTVVTDPVTTPLDIFAPCALGGVLDDETVPALRAEIVCGAANNQLAHPGVDELLEQRGILYAPDYLVNAGGEIQVSDEQRGFDFARARRKASAIFDTTKAVLALAGAEGVPPATAADRVAERRLAAAGRR
ncbi:MAG TPA: Glu/Leu/Phe/Val dehydrogenase dimerization domain-containing protein [Amycolatopsis sp.]|nr:Glu/Leu/Phe/Val dehydrogenase dimerization domain-containing protein [Amycolatopsis sp.]